MLKIPKKWRELPIKEKFDIPNRYFKIDNKTIKKIRKISDIRQRLIAAAKIQYEMFNDIHSYLTVWIAGYGSDVMIRQKFGSTQNLLNLFFKPEKFPKNIKPSWQDIKRRVKLPEEMTEDLAEETGIHIGDGNLYINKNITGNSYQYCISGDLINESIYHYDYIRKLIRHLYNLESKILERAEKNNVDSRIKSKAVVEFKSKILKLPIGSKKFIRMPSSIIRNREFAKKCVAGIIDTDFTITSSMAITGKLYSLIVTKQINKILEENRIPHIFRVYSDYARFYIQKPGAIKIIEEWRLKNQKHLSKYKLFKEFKKFIPFSTTPERLAVLEGKLDAEELEKICQKRRVSKI
jgi:hypothetical protein